MINSTLEVEQKKQIDIEIVPLIERTRNLIVKTHDERGLLVSEIKRVKTLRESYEQQLHLTANRLAAKELYDASRDTEKTVYDPIDNFVIEATKAVKTFDTSESLRIQKEQREIAEKEVQRERESQAQREAEAKAAQEAEERAALAEYERLEAEKEAKKKLQASAEASGNAKVAGIAAKEVAKIDNQIQQVQETHEAKIEEIKAKAEDVPAPKLHIQAPQNPVKKLAWKARVSNTMKLCRSVVAGDVPFNIIEVSQVELNKFAKGYDGETKIEGLEFYQESTGRL